MNERHVNPEDPDLYALGALDGQEKQALEAHVRACDACAQQVEAARRRVALLSLAAPPVAPRPEVKESLMRRVRAERPVRQPAPAQPAPRRFGWLTPALSFATIVFAVLSGYLYTRNQSASQRIQALEAQLSNAETRSREIAKSSADTDSILGAPGTIRVDLAQQPGMAAGRAAVLYNARMGMVVCAGQLAEAPSDKSYQLWIVPATGAPMSLGVMSSMDPAKLMTAHIPPGMEAKAFAITVEPKGGMPQPTGPKVLVGLAS
jgi:anti-sigma-K factor RskA